MERISTSVIFISIRVTTVAVAVLQGHFNNITPVNLDLIIKLDNENSAPKEKITVTTC